MSDYLKGVVTRRLMASLVAASQARGVPVFVDPKIPHIDYYAGVSLVTPNHHEAEMATNLRIRTNEDARRAAEAFRERTKCAGVLITMGEHGMWLAADGVEGHLAATAREVADVTGAGDTVVATLALGDGRRRHAPPKPHSSRTPPPGSSSDVRSGGGDDRGADRRAGRGRQSGPPRQVALQGRAEPAAATPAPQCRKCLLPVNTIARPCSSAAAITSASRTDPPGCTTAVAPAAATASSPSRNGK